MNDSFNLFLPLSKVERQRDGSVTVSGYCSTPTLDLDGEIVSLDAIRKALPGYWAWRNIRQMHQSSAVGVGKEANIDGKGCFLTAKITDKEAAQKCLDGVYKGFSIGGRKLAKEGNTITEIDWVETSIVDRPANPDAKFDVAKQAKDGENAFLIKTPKSFRDPKDRALNKMAQAVSALAEAGPAEFLVDSPTVSKSGDGFSAPAKVACKAHGLMDCSKCAMKAAKKIAKREVKQKEREALASQGDALPGGGFPIKNKGDLANARQAVGRAKNPGAARALIRRRARELGVALPDTWSKKFAKTLIATVEAERFVLAKNFGSAEPSFLTLAAEGDGGVAEGMQFGHELQSVRRAPQDDGRLSKRAKKLAAVGGHKTDFVADQGFLNLGGRDMKDKTEKGAALALDTTQFANDPAAAYILDIMKRASAPSRAARMNMARGDLKKAKKAAKDAEDVIKAAHAMHKAAYLSKAAGGKKKPADDGDADDFDHQGAMEKLQKAFGDLQTLKTMVKSASTQLKKAASRSGQRGQEVSDGNSDYQVPAGVKDLSPGEVEQAGPGGPVFQHGMETAFPGKSAKIQKGMVSANEAALAAELAAANARVEILSAMPAAPAFGKKPVLVDMTKIAGGTRDEAAAIMKGVDPSDLTKDETSNTHAISRMIGNMIVGGHGKSVLDGSFNGTGGLA